MGPAYPTGAPGLGTVQGAALYQPGGTGRCSQAVLLLSAVTAALLPAGPAVARPRRADLAITGMVAGPTQVLAGEVVGIGVNVANVGTRVADTVTVTVTIPPSLQPPSPGELGPAWA
jgi:hypothetical protein